MADSYFSDAPGIGMTDFTANSGLVSPVLLNGRTLYFFSTNPGQVPVKDAGITRSAANTIQLTNGAAGFGDLSLGGLLLKGAGTKVANYPFAVTGESVVIANAAGLTITLPSAVTYAGKVLIVKNGASGTNTVIASAAGNIDGGASPQTLSGLAAAKAAMRFWSDGTDWWSI